jgi:HD-like signal output (HDOD) protein
MQLLKSRDKPIADLSISAARATRFVSDIDIPARPRILKQIDELEDDIQAISALVMQDLALSAAVLKVVNSAWVALPNQISRIDQAVVLLGIENVKNIIRAVCFRNLMEKVVEPKLIKRFWEASLKTAVCTSVVARFLHLANHDEAYALGLFHNCGIPILSSHFNHIDALVTECYSDPSANMLLNEIRAINVDHASIGYRVACAWNLPDFTAQAIRDHHSLKTHDFEAYSQTNSLLVCLKLGEYFSEEHLILGASEENHEWQKYKKICMDYVRIDDRDMQDLSDFCDMQLLGLAKK